MIESLTEDNLALLLPHIRFFCRDEARDIRDFMYESLGIGEDIEWDIVPAIEFAELGSSDEIEPFLIRNLGKDFDQKSYLLWSNGLLAAGKTSLSNILKNYSSLKKDLDEMWIWGMEAGYIVEDYLGKIRICTVPSIVDRFPMDALEKKSFRDFPKMLPSDFKSFLESFGMKILYDKEANEQIAIFKEKFPLNELGNIDWPRIEKKLDAGDEHEKIISALKIFIGDNFDNTISILWREQRFPFITTTLNHVISNFRCTRDVASEAFLFNLTDNYVIEVRFPLHITVGVLPK